MTDMVNSPSHYNQGRIECIEGLNSALSPEEYKGFLRGNAIKYLWRCGHKDNPTQELEKAKWYINKLLEVYNES